MGKERRGKGEGREGKRRREKGKRGEGKGKEGREPYSNPLKQFPHFCISSAKQAQCTEFLCGGDERILYLIN